MPSGKFNEPWFDLAFKDADELTREDKAEILARAFQVNHERLLTRWPRFVELYEWSRAAGGAQALITFTRARLAGFAVAVATGVDGRRVAGEGSRWSAGWRIAGKDFSEKDKDGSESENN